MPISSCSAMQINFGTDMIMAQRQGPVYVRQVLHDREILADSVVGAVALGRGAKPRCSAQSVQSTIPYVIFWKVDAQQPQARFLKPCDIG